VGVEDKDCVHGMHGIMVHGHDVMHAFHRSCVAWRYDITVTVTVIARERAPARSRNTRLMGIDKVLTILINGMLWGTAGCGFDPESQNIGIRGGGDGGGETTR